MCEGSFGGFFLFVIDFDFLMTCDIPIRSL
jgi:hypothetical protein